MYTLKLHKMNEVLIFAVYRNAQLCSYVSCDLATESYKNSKGIQLSKWDVQQWLKIFEIRHELVDVDSRVYGNIKSVTKESSSRGAYQTLDVELVSGGETVKLLACSYRDAKLVRHLYTVKNPKFTLLQVFKTSSGYLAYYLRDKVMVREVPILNFLREISTQHAKQIALEVERHTLYDTEVRKFKCSAKTKQARAKKSAMFKRNAKAFKVEVNSCGYQITHLSCGHIYWRDRLSYLVSDCGVCPKCGESRSLSSPSKGELLVRDWLVQEGYAFEMEKSLPHLQGDKWYLRCDFVVQVGDKQLIVEVQGNQHYDNSYYRSGGRYDDLKVAYARNNHMYLVAIPSSLREGSMRQLLRESIEYIESGGTEYIRNYG